MAERTNWDVVIRALARGSPVTLGARTYKIIKAGEPIVAVSGVFEADNDVLCDVLTCNGEEITLPSDLKVNDLIKLADSLTEAERINCVFNSVGRI